MTYQASSSYQLMENHISAAVLDGSEGFSAWVTGSEVSVLLSIGSDQILRASVESAGSQTGWTVVDLSTQLASQYTSTATLTASSVSASFNPANNSLIALLALSISDGQSTYDEAWLLSGPASTDPSQWLLDPTQRQWSRLAYDATPSTDGITAKTLQIGGVYLENGLEAADGVLAIAMVDNPQQPDQLCCFLLNLKQGASPVWTSYPQEQDIGTQGLQIVPGRTTWSPHWGLFKLYSLGGTPSLTFLPSQGAYGPPDAVDLTVPAGASAIATLAYPALGNTTYTDLFVAGSGGISWFPYNQQRPHTGTIVIAGGMVSNVQALHVVNLDGTVVLWGLTGASAATPDTVFYATVPLGQQFNPSAWSAPVTLMTGVSAVAPVQGGDADTLSLYAVGPLGNSNSTGSTAPGLVLLQRVGGGSAWLNAVQPLPSTTDCITLKSYTTRILVSDENNLPQPNVSVRAEFSCDCRLILNGVTADITAGESISLQTDGGGYLTIIHAVSSLATPRITLTLPGPVSVPVIDPTSGVRTQLQGITRPEQLTGATYVDAQGDTRNLTTKPANAQGVVNALRAINGHMPNLPTTAAFKAAGNVVTLHEPAGDSIPMLLGDLVQSVVNVVEEVADIVFLLIDDVVHFVVTIGTDIFDAIINTVEDALNAITALFKWIGAEIDAVFRWLGFLFDWSDFVAVKNVFSGAIMQSLRSLGGMLTTLRTSGDEWCAYTKANIVGTLTSLPVANVGSGSLNSSWGAAQPAPSPVGADKTDMTTDPRIGWLKDRASTPPNSGASAPTLHPAAVASETMSDLMQAFATALKDVIADIGSLVDGSVSPKAFLDNVLAQLETLGVDVLQAAFDAMCEAVQTLLANLEEIVNTPIDIPILSSLYYEATGHDLTFMDLTCLVLGIGTTLCYKIATGDSPVAPLTAALTQTAVQNVFSQSLTPVLTPPSSSSTSPTSSSSLTTATEAARTSAVQLGQVAPGDDAPDALMKFTGTLLIVQAVTMAADAIGDGRQNPKLANVAFFMDVIGRTARGLLEIIDDGEPMQIGGTQVKVEFIWNCIVTLGTFGNLYREGLASKDAITTSENDYVISLIWGIWETVNIGKICSETGDVPIGRVGEAVIELLEVFQSLCLKSDNLVAGGIIAAIRCASAIVAGVERL